MKRLRKLLTLLRKGGAVGGGLLLLSGCEMPIALDPKGPAAAEMAFLWWVLFWIATVVSIIVFILFFIAIRRARRQDNQRWQETKSTAFVAIGGGVIPTVILIGVLFMTLSSMRTFDTPPATNVTINVTGHMFWWEARYEEEGFTTANEIHIPVGEPVRINLESQDVIHSFWVPQLHGKIEMIPGWTNTMYLEASEPGIYFGKCAEFCGIQHANMEFLVIAQERQDYEAWVAHQRQPAPEPFDELTRLGQQVFLGSACVYCHTIRGTTASGRLGPDLTHLASRLTLGARMLENNRGNLAGWTVNAQAIKPGNRMPPMYMEPEALHAILAYMEMLE